jgi:thiol:disulfide interchange protein DsbD
VGATAPVATALVILALLGSISLLLLISKAPPPASASLAAAEAPAPAGPGLTSEPWSPEKLAALRAEGRPVLVDFTAAWCVTCQVNEKVALSGPAVAQAFKDRNAVLLKADWTNRDATIAAALAEHGRAGVPLYLVYPAKGGDPVILPQLLTEGMVIEAIEKAAS